MDLDLGHGFLPRIDARNYKAVERCLPRDGPGLYHEALDLKWAVLEGPWAIEHGDATIQMCKDRGVAFLVDTQAWRYWDARTFATDKFTAVPYAPPRPLGECTRDEAQTFVRTSVERQYTLGASAYLLPGIVPSSAGHDVHEPTLSLLGKAEEVLPSALPCIAFVGAHTSSMDRAYRLVSDLPNWLTGVYVQFTPMNPLHDSPSKIVDCLTLLALAAKRDFVVIGGRLAGLGMLARALGVQGADAGLGEGESFDYGTKVSSHLGSRDGVSSGRPFKGRLYVPQLGRSLSSDEWGRLMQVPALRGHLLCRLPCCAFGRSVDETPGRGREHSLHSRIDEAKWARSSALHDVLQVLEQRQSFARTVRQSLGAADLDAISTQFLDNHIAAVRYFLEQASRAA